MNMRRDQRGFTLMELMVVIVIVAILAAVAVPLYINYVQDAHRTEARGAIGAIITAQQAFYQRSGGTEYADNLQQDLGYPPTPGVASLVDISEADVNWNFFIRRGDATGFMVEAIGDAGPAVGLNVRYTYNRTGPDAGGQFEDF
jgi:prepilin-type N-terminal cleavage/methylation domain-containing protein